MADFIREFIQMILFVFWLLWRWRTLGVQKHSIFSIFNSLFAMAACLWGVREHVDFQVLIILVGALFIYGLVLFFTGGIHKNELAILNHLGFKFPEM